MTNRTDIDVDVGDAIDAVQRWKDLTDEGASDAVDTLATLGEGQMKDEAPNGAGIPDVSLQNTIAYNKSTDGKRATIKPDKMTSEGWPLHHAIVGSPRTPRYDEKRPPVWTDSTGVARGPLAEWTHAKLGSRRAAFAVANNIRDRGTQQSFPDPFVYRAAQSLNRRTQSIATDAVARALG